MRMDIALDQALRNTRRRRRLPPPEARRRLRTGAGVSQAAIAQALGVTSAAVCRWERGSRSPRNPDLVDAYNLLLDLLALERLGR